MNLPSTPAAARQLVRAGYQIPLFTYPNTAPEDLFARVVDQARAAEESGFDSVWVMDHFWQLPMLGPTELEMLEGYTTLGALAMVTERVRLGTLVTGVTYRNPALLAKIVTTLDVASRGRAICGIGAAWFEEEHVGLGVDFPPLAVRFEMLSEALEILRAMFRDERPTFEGEHYRVESAINSPAPLQDGGVPIMVGGSGEKKTLPMGASTADAINLSAGRSELSRKVDVINSALGTAGRSRDEINVSWLCTLVLGDDGADAEQRLRDMVSSRGMDPSMLDDESVRPMVLDRIIVGDADSAVTQLRDAASAGLDGIIVNLPADGGSTDAVRSAAEVVLAAVPDPA
ncbi:MAG: LLM class F420-dependent oxidoreductase [Microthrixaceae bacterium]|nr:LLM class F420-dependent oxidoreductase [Microthrixaceae bacterium]MCB1010691.1 LLM class F420-dependent oxidoreductase [Microthrixaceae bacterium]MCB9386297.1 LLM class F420-dependent oxidoreductase [Microthrixaceae bacterium]MCO5320980.1 LLM class F420-dependent oxidoreductase [Microthrixaceae bacterium]